MPESFTKSNFSYGGQAVIEGVMMRGSKRLSVAVRNPNDEIVIHTEPLDPRIYGGRLARIPFVRGLTLLWDALGLGIKSLMFSAEVALEDEKEEHTIEARQESWDAENAFLDALEALVQSDAPLTTKSDVRRRLLDFNAAYQLKGLRYFAALRLLWERQNPGRTFHGLCAEVDSV
ncbi:MAG: DUF1385 domain-containing protein, partial [Candidatus Promineifilaceae bacterium]